MKLPHLSIEQWISFIYLFKTKVITDYSFIAQRERGGAVERTVTVTEILGSLSNDEGYGFENATIIRKGNRAADGRTTALCLPHYLIFKARNFH